MNRLHAQQAAAAAQYQAHQAHAAAMAYQHAIMQHHQRNGQIPLLLHGSVQQPPVKRRTIGKYNEIERKRRLERHREKRRSLTFRTVKYRSRQNISQKRPRINGRFVPIPKGMNIKSDPEFVLSKKRKQANAAKSSVAETVAASDILGGSTSDTLGGTTSDTLGGSASSLV